MTHPRWTFAGRWLACLMAFGCIGLPQPAHGAAPPADPAAARLVARMIEAFGGRGAIERVHAYRMEGTIQSGARSGPTTRVFQRPDRLKVILDYPEGAETRLVKGNRGWRASGDERIDEVQGPMLDAMVLQMCRSGAPWILLEHGAEAHTIAARSQDGHSLPGVELVVGEGLRLRLWVDPGSGRIRVSQGELTHFGMNTHFETVYGDWRKVGALWFAHEEENFASGTRTGTTVFRKITLDPELRPDEFAPPAPGAAPGPGDTL